MVQDVAVEHTSTPGSRPAAPAGARGEHRTLEYRPQLDGLRAVAVLLVFVFHAVPTWLTGGFIGVDVFFVLSGYLITLILLEQTSLERRGILRSFYARRVRRLLPASLVLLVTVAVRESLWGSLLDRTARFQDIRATVLYVANWHLIQKSDDYFAEFAGVSPLRHMWSLAVEEQFYFVWPVVLLIGVALGRRFLGLMVITAVLALASMLTMALLYEPSTVTRAYYGTDARVFQPLIGALLAIWTYRRNGAEITRTPRAGTPLVVGGLSLAAIGVMSFSFDGSDGGYFRGGAVIVGVAAAAAIWALERSRPLGAVVGSAPLAALGRISYGFYLWHWPVILWIRPSTGATWSDRRLVNLVQLAVTIALATASFVLLERPVRISRVLRDRRLVLAGAAVAMLTTIGVSSWLLRPLTGGNADVAAAAIADFSVQACPENPQPCVKYDPGVPSAPTVMTVGDSTMQMYDPALMLLAEQYGFRYVQAAVGGCPIGDRLIATGTNGDLHKPSNFMCYDDIPGIYQTAIGQWPPTLILATSSNEGSQHVTDGVLVERGTDQHRREMHDALEDALDVLTATGAHVVFLSVLPGGPTVDCLETSAANTDRCVRAVPDPQPNADVNALFQELAEERDDVTGVIDFTDLICPNGECPLMVDDTVVRYDGGHFTGTWSRSMAPRLDDRLRALGVDLATLG